MKNDTIKRNQIILMDSEQLHDLFREIQEVKKIVQKTSSQDELPELLRTSEVSKLLKIGESSLAGLRSNGTIPFTKIGGTIYYLKKDIKRLIVSNYSGLS